MSEDLSIVNGIEYRLIRPDGTLLWTCTAADYMPEPVPPVSVSTSIGSPENYVEPPWRYERRGATETDWTLLREAPEPAPVKLAPPINVDLLISDPTTRKPISRRQIVMVKGDTWHIERELVCIRFDDSTRAWGHVDIDIHVS